MTIVLCMCIQGETLIKYYLYINRSDEGKKMMSIATHNINKQFKHVLVYHSDVSPRICLETTHRVHNDGLAGM